MRREIVALATGSLIALVGGPLVTYVASNARAPSAVAGLSSMSSTNARVLPSFARLPLAFESNMGQTDPQVRFLSRGPGSTTFLTRNGAVFSLRKGGPTRPQSDRALFGMPGRSDVLSMTFVGADALAPAAGKERLPGSANSFIGNDRSAWRTNIPTYARV